MKKLNIFGIRKKVILSHFRGIKEEVSVMMPITEEQEKEIISSNKFVNDDYEINMDNIYAYGEINLNTQEDINAIKSFNLIDDGDTANIVYSNTNYETGEVEYDKVPKYYSEWDILKWFKYNLCLIGNPKRIIIFKIRRNEL